MEGVRSWVLSVVAVGMLVSLCLGLSPGGQVQKVSRFCGGLILFLAVVTPLTRLDVTGVLSEFRSYCDQLAGPEESLTETGAALTEELVTRQAEQLIQTEVRALGAELTVRVTCRSRDGLPVPWAVTLTGPLNDDQRKALTDWLADTFALSREQVHFQTKEEAEE